MEPPSSKPSFDSLVKGDDKAESVKQMYKHYPDLSQKFWREQCRNCFLSGKGLVPHTFYDCQRLGNPCVMRCAKCKKGNHWTNECTA